MTYSLVPVEKEIEIGGVLIKLIGFRPKPNIVWLPQSSIPDLSQAQVMYVL